MSEHRVAIEWELDNGPFTYDAYSREHVWQFEGGPRVHASAAPEYLGTAGHVDPEQALVAAVASCHMLTFLAIAARRRLTVEQYRDAATGILEQGEQGQLAVTRIVLRPIIRFAEDAAGRVDRAALRSLHERAHRDCFIANSVRSEIHLDLSAQWGDASEASPARVSAAGD